MSDGTSRLAPPISDPRLTALLQHWRSARKDKAMPARRDIDAARIPAIMKTAIFLLPPCSA